MFIFGVIVIKSAFKAAVPMGKVVLKNTLQQTDVSWRAERSGLYSAASGYADTVKESVVQASSTLAQSYINAQKEKEQRAEHSVGPVVREVGEKTKEFLASDLNDQFDIIRNLKQVKDEHAENKADIHQMKEYSKQASAVVEKGKPVLTKVLSNPKMVEQIASTVSTVSKAATKLHPVLNAANTAYSVYQATKTLYPEETAQAENYVSEKFNESVSSVKNTLSEKAKTLSSFVPDFKDSTHDAQPHIKPSAR